MSDRRLRELERRWRDAGGSAEQAEWLRARLRAGELDGDRLELAAWCGHAAARLALDWPPSVEPPSCGDELARGLSAWGRDLVLRVAVMALGRACEGKPDLPLGVAVRAVEAHRGCPCALHREALTSVREHTQRVMEEEVHAQRFERAALACAVRALVEGVVFAEGPDELAGDVGFYLTPHLAECREWLIDWALDSARGG